MYRFFLVGALLVAGCQGVGGPFAPRSFERVDHPGLPIDEQQRRGRDRYALPDESPARSDNLSPRTFVDRPGPHGR